MSIMDGIGLMEVCLGQGCNKHRFIQTVDVQGFTTGQNTSALKYCVFAHQLCIFVQA